MKSYLTIFSNTLSQILARAITAITALFVTRLITSNLGLTGFGNYQMVINYVTLFWLLTDFGLNAIVVKEMAASEEKVQSYFSTLLTLRIGLSLILILISILMTMFLPYPLVVKKGISVASLTILFQALMGSAHAIFQVKLHYVRQLIASFAGSLLLIFLTALTIKHNWGVLGLTSSFTASYLIMMLVSLVLAFRWVTIRLHFNKQELLPIIKKTLPLGCALLFNLANSKIGSILLALLPLRSLPNSEAVGLLNLGLKFFELVLVVPVFFMNVMYPIFVRHFQENRKRFAIMVKRSLLFLLSASLFVLFVLYVLSPWLIRILAEGEDISGAISVLRILSISVPIFYSTPVLMWVLMVFGKQKTLIFVYASAFIFNFAANYLFIPRFSYLSVSVVTGLSEFFVLAELIFFAFFYWKKINVKKE